jgi:mono/diheme cytochrome c family protein
MKWTNLGAVAMRRKGIAFLAAGAVAFVAIVVCATVAFGPAPFKWAGGHPTALDQYHGVDPTGVPTELKSANFIKRGEYLARAADCSVCHTAQGGLPYAGGLAFATPFGALYSTNITPDKATGIGNYSNAEFLNAVHRGIRRDGARLYPAMPYASYTYMTDADALAIKAFLFSLKPVHAPARANALGFPFNQRYLMAAWSLLFNADERFRPNSDRSPEWNRGAYLVEAMGHCGECHTPRNMFQGLNNNAKFAGAFVDNWRAYNITGDPESGLGAWKRADIARYLSTGHADGHGTATGPMGQVVADSLSYLAATDIEAITSYLVTIPPIAGRDGVARKAATSKTPVLTDDRGSVVFETSCAACHGSNGVSKISSFANFAGSRAVNDSSGTNIIQVILNGDHDYRTMMPAFDRVLSDSDIASVANYVTARFGTRPSAISAERVAKVRSNFERSLELAVQTPLLSIPNNIAWDPAPKQPIPFDHHMHVGFGLQCSVCHTNSTQTAEMSLPQASTCMTCHAAVAADKPAIKKLAAFARSGQPIPWVRVFPLTAGVQFKHDVHVRAGVPCASCHGQVDREHAVSETTALTSMATCISCHQAQHARTDCATCHAWPNPISVAVSADELARLPVLEKKDGQ